MVQGSRCFSKLAAQLQGETSAGAPKGLHICKVNWCLIIPKAKSIDLLHKLKILALMLQGVHDMSTHRIFN